MPSKSKPGAETPDPMETLDGLEAAPAGEEILPGGSPEPGLDTPAEEKAPAPDGAEPAPPREETSALDGETPPEPPADGGGSETPPEPAKKAKKKPAGKKAAKADEAAPSPEDAQAPPPDPVPPVDAPPQEAVEDEGPTDGAEETGGQAQEPAPEKDAAGQAIDDSLEPIQAPKAVRRPAATGHKRIYDLKLNELDRDLSAEQRQEWNDIYASFRAKTVLTGMALGVDHVPMSMRDKDTGEEARHRMNCMVVIQYRVKVLIPESEMWFPGAERPDHVMQNMVGGEIDYVIMDVDREGECAVASRRMALAARRHYFATAPKGHQAGELLNCRVLAVGPKRCMLECAGYDITLSQRDLTYVSVPDLREKYHPGQTLPCILKEYDAGAERLVISIKEVNPNPFDGACLRHPINSRRQAAISGKYGGVFCTLPDDTTVMCLYCAQHADQDFQEGDNVIIAIKSYDFEKEQIFGRILAKW